MKVIGIIGNYHQADMGEAYLMADSSILFTGRPFFVPDFGKQFIATPSIVIRYGRLGKCVDERFAYRYYDALTAGFAVQALEAPEPRLSVLNRAFDGSAIVGDWVKTSEVSDVSHIVVDTAINGKPISSCCLADMTVSVDHLIALVSERCSIKMGDLLFTGDTAQGHHLAAGDRLTASINGNVVLDVKVKL